MRKQVFPSPVGPFLPRIDMSFSRELKSLILGMVFSVRIFEIKSGT